jgi:hypothetical protein
MTDIMDTIRKQMIPNYIISRVEILYTTLCNAKEFNFNDEEFTELRKILNRVEEVIEDIWKITNSPLPQS